MSKSIYNSSWYRVAELKPWLRPHAEIHRQRFRGEIWYVLQDHVSGRFHRFSPAAYMIISMMNGRHTVQEIWETAGGRLGDDLPSQDEIVQLLAQMHSADMLNADVPTDIVELSDRQEKSRKQAFWQKVKNPLAIRIPLLDPDDFLTATLPLVRPLFSSVGVVIWLAVVVVGVVLAGQHWQELTENVVDRVLATDNLLLLAVVYPVVKAFHELGHAFTVKKWGGEVHEMGFLLLLLMPVPYVDASSSAAFREKGRRAMVGAAGIGVEIFIAALAMLVWVNVEPGTVRAMAYNTMLTAGVSTLLFNGNPLLRFDGYYVFSDLIEIPNLGGRSNKYVMYLVQRYLFGMEGPAPQSAPGERPWFVFYGVAAFLYRMTVMTGIVLLVATKLFAIGIALAIWAAFNMFVMPLVKGLMFVLRSPRLKLQRRRAVIVTGGFTGALAGFLLLAPMPLSTVTEGVVWSTEKSRIHAPTEGMIVRILVKPNGRVKKGEPVILLEDPLLQSQVRILQAEVRELELRLKAANVADLVQANVMEEKMKHSRAKLEQEQLRAGGLTLFSPADGTFVMPRSADAKGRFVKRGDLLGFVVDDLAPVVRAVVAQADIDLIRGNTQGVSVRFASQVLSVRRAEIIREVPAATDQLPSMALSTSGGGTIDIDPTDTESLKTFENYFQFDIGLPGQASSRNLGERVYVRFDHGYEAISMRLYRSVRRLFLKKFDV